MKQKSTLKKSKAISSALSIDRTKTSLYLSVAVYQKAKEKLKKEHPTQSVSNLIEALLKSWNNGEIE